MGLYLFTWVCAYGKVPTVNPSVTAKATGGSPAVPAPFSKGAPACRRCRFRTMVLYDSLLPCPARYRFIVRYRVFTDFQSTAWERRTQNPTNPNGGRDYPPAPEPKRRVNLPMVPPGGFSRGEQFERERVVPPLSRLLCLLSCRSKKVRPCWQALAEG